MSEPQPAVTGDDAFIVTKEYKLFAEFCDACRREKYIGLCYGPPGVGKTLSARHYTKWQVFEPLFGQGVIPHSLPLEAIEAVKSCRSVFYTPPVSNSPNVLGREINHVRCHFDVCVDGAIHFGQEDRPMTGMPDYCHLLIVDEADRLKTPGLEQIRDIYDRGTMGLVLIGMPGLEKRLARYPQFFSRVGFAHRYQCLGESEIQFLLQNHWQKLGLELNWEDFSDAEAVAAIIRITGGNFRLLNRLLAQIRRVLQINQMQTVTREVVEAARECLVIGAV